MASDRPGPPPSLGRLSQAILVSLAVLAACLPLAACTGGSGPGTLGAPTTTSFDASTCRVSAELVPSCGALWGVTTQRPTVADLSATEASVGRRFDFVYRFHDLNDVVPTPAERALVRAGRALHLSIDSRDFTPGRPPTSWAAVAAGDWDPSLRRQAQGIASLGVPVFVTFEHEADQSRKAALGTPADFIAAWRHVHALFVAAGATQAVWTWVATGWQPGFAAAAAFWPGNDVVDWISWEGYNQSGCQSGTASPSRYISFAAAIGGFYQWLMQHGQQYQIDTGKPMMISEAGSVVYPDHPELTARWYAGIPAALRQYPRIKAIGLWDHTGTGSPACDFRFSQRPLVLRAVTVAGKDDWVNIPLRR